MIGAIRLALYHSRHIISKTTSSGEESYLRRSKGTRPSARRSSTTQAVSSQKPGGTGSDQTTTEDRVGPSEESSKPAAEKDPIAAAVEKIRQIDPEMLANLARAFLKPAQATG